MTTSPRLVSSLALVAACAALVAVPRASAKVLDNFDAAQRAGWEDANPANQPLPGGAQAGGKFTFNLPALGQAYFVSSRKTTETFELKEGRTVEFRVDLDSGQGPDSFAVLAFIPQSTGPNTLAGYGIAKSETDILITKGINKYFLNENPTPAVKNNNVTLVLNLEVRNGNVIIHGQVLDRDDNHKVIYEKTYVDTPAADVLADGQDSPPTPFINLAGNFVLYLYADGGKDPAGYQVVYDNAETLVVDTTVVDDFNAAQRSGWEDANPANQPLPGGVQANGQFTIGLPALGQAYFVSSRKTTKTYELTEGTRHEFAVDLLSGRGGESFAVLAWIPTATGPNTLAGYGLAKSETDILVTKGINKYFMNEAPTPAIKNTNVRLVLTLTVRNGDVTIRSRVLDKDDNDRVIFDRTFVDTPAADVFADGQDSPPAPFIAMGGNVVLYLYADGGKDPAGYQVVYDNLAVGTPPVPANEPPSISGIAPGAGANFLPTSTAVSFTAADDKALPDAGIVLTLNGTNYSAGQGLTLSAAGTSRTATFTGLAANVNYAGLISVTDSEGVARTATLFFDTYSATQNRIVEIEDYNFESGQYLNNPVRTGEGGSAADAYNDRVGTPNVDFYDTRATPNAADTMYRTADPIRMQRSLDWRRAAFNNDLLIYDYDVGDIAANEWMHYTRDFAAGSYEVYLRESVVNFVQADSVLEQVTGDPAQPDPAVKSLGSFLGKTSGFTFRNVPLTDGTGQNKVVLRLSGKTTLRLRQVTPNDSSGARYLNYLLFVPVADVGPQRATVASLAPTDGATVDTTQPRIEIVVQNRDTSANASTLKLEVNGVTVTPGVSNTASGLVVTYALTPLPPAGATNTAKVSFKDGDGVDISSQWSFVVNYRTLDPANRRPLPGTNRGLLVRVVQAPEGSALANDLSRAEDQLAANTTIPIAMETNVVKQFVDMAQDDRTSGFFQREYVVPGLEEMLAGTDDFAVDVRGWLELAAGTYRFGAVTDDGYKCSSGKDLNDRGGALLGFYNGGPANATFDFVVSQAGLYPFRFMWYERGGNAYAEWFSVNLATGERTLINDPDAPNAIKAYQTAPAAPTLVVEGALSVTGGFAAVSNATVDTGAQTVTIPLGTEPMRFFRLSAAAAQKIVSVRIAGGNLVLQYQAN